MKTFREKAIELTSACTEPVGIATCPFSWNNCRRTGKCEQREEIEKALQEVMEDYAC